MLPRLVSELMGLVSRLPQCLARSGSHDCTAAPSASAAVDWDGPSNLVPLSGNVRWHLGAALST